MLTRILHLCRCGALERPPPLDSFDQSFDNLRESIESDDTKKFLGASKIMEVRDKKANRDSGNRDAGSDRKSTRLNSSHLVISYAVFCLKKKTKTKTIKMP